MTPNPSPYVLLVEDDENDVLLTERAFRNAGMTAAVRVARDGEEAVAHLSELQGAQGAPRVVLLDLKLPRRSGFEVLAWLRQQPGLRRLPVIVLTSSDDALDVKRCYELGANSYLVKPVGREKMADIARLIDQYWLQLNTPPGVGEG